MVAIKNTVVKLDNWAVVVRSFDPYRAPELQASSLHGNCRNHPRFADGSEVTTSDIVGKRGEYVLTKSGSVYELGTTDPNYEKLYPNAKHRLLTTLKEV